MTQLNGYRIMWVITMFDLPTSTKPERKSASTFRTLLLKSGFQMLQFSVYIKNVLDQTKVERLVLEVASEIPRDGRVDILVITDKQYEKIFTYYGLKKIERKNPSHLTLF